MRANRSMGFTLLEVMIAIAIFAIAISIVYGLYSSIVSVVDNVETRIQLNDKARIVFARIGKDLQGLYRGEQGYLRGSDSADPPQDEPILEYISSAHLSFSPDSAPAALAVIRYYLERAESDDAYYLLRSDTPVATAEDDEPEEGRKFRLCEGLAEVRIQYLDGNGDQQSEWDTTEGSDEEQLEDNRFPGLVTIELVFPTNASVDSDTTVYSSAVLLRPAVIAFAEGIGG